MNDFASGDSGDTFTAEEQAALDAYERGDDAGAGSLELTAGGAEPPAGGAAAPEPAAAAGTPAGEAAAPGEVVDPENETGSADENKGKFVRHGAFHQERERRKAVEKELTELREKFTRGDERMRLLTEAMQRQATPAAPAAAAQAAQPTEPPKRIDPNEDIFGAYRQLQEDFEALRTGQTQQSETLKRQEEARQEEAAREQTLTAYRADIQNTVRSDATFVDAYRHLIDGRVSEMKLLGYSDADAIKAVNDEEFSLVQSALSRGQSPASLVLQLAKSRGFVAKAPEPAPAPTLAETPVEKAARTAAGQAGPGRSLSAAGGAPAGEITATMLAEMSEADFEKLVASNPQRVRALMGG
jgi:hypothetical protein